MQKRVTKYKAVMQRQDGVMYVSQGYGLDSGFLSYLFDFENNRWDKFLETITTEEKFVKLFPDDDEDLKSWTHIENIQYTGLKDKNDVEIYEGDIVSHDGFLGYVKYINRGNCNVLGYALSSVINSRIFYMYCDEADKYEVIGNIYENKELINEIK